MDIWDILTWISKKLCWILFRRKHMTLSAKAQESARIHGLKSCRFSRFVDRLFWFDSNHCRNAYARYRLDRLNRYKSRE